MSELMETQHQEERIPEISAIERIEQMEHLCNQVLIALQLGHIEPIYRLVKRDMAYVLSELESALLGREWTNL